MLQLKLNLHIYCLMMPYHDYIISVLVHDLFILGGFNFKIYLAPSADPFNAFMLKAACIYTSYSSPPDSNYSYLRTSIYEIWAGGNDISTQL